MRTINEIIIHCSATKEGNKISAATIDRWHKDRGWRCIGYHYVVRIDGSIEYGRPVQDIGANVKGKNKHSIGVCYIGGLDADMEPKDTRTPEQKEALLAVLRTLKAMYPEAIIYSHNEFANKACPSFDATNEYKDL